MNNKKNHLWIPDEEVKRIDKTVTARSKVLYVEHQEHGRKLSDELGMIKEDFQDSLKTDSLNESGLMAFKIEMIDGVKIKDQFKIFDSNGIKVRAVKTESKAIVTTNSNQFLTLSRKIEEYTKNGNGKTYFDYIKSFDVFCGDDKKSSSMKKILKKESEKNVDIQLMILPNLSEEDYSKILKKFIPKIINISNTKYDLYYLSDSTPVIRTIIPSCELKELEKDNSIYRIEPTDFFKADTFSESAVNLDNLVLEESVSLENLPVVVVLDSGVKFPLGIENLVIEQWISDPSIVADYEHGTKVASRVALGYIADKIIGGVVTPRARIIDSVIMEDSVAVPQFIKRIQQSVIRFYERAKIFNLSANSPTPIEGDEMSIVGYELDVLQRKYEVQFVLSSGNHELWKTETSLVDILTDDDSRISSPADSMNSIVVGSLSGYTYPNSLSKENEVASYSRIGPGFNGFSKPDLSAYAGSISFVAGSTSVPEDKFSLLLDHYGNLSPDAGTSFSAPIVAGDLAEILNIVPGNDVLLAKALLYHHAQALWDIEEIEDEHLTLFRNLYGRGLSKVSDSVFSSSSKVTFVRTGQLNKLTKERVKIYMPELLAAKPGRNIARVTVTVVSRPPVDQTKGTEYLGAYVRASLKKKGEKENHIIGVQPDFKEGRQKWDVCHQFTKLFSKMNSGDWEIWLEMFSRWDERDLDVDYSLVVTIEDVSGTLDIYSEIEAQNRYRSINSLRVRTEIK